MKKRILALALAGTTAFSVFGGLNVFAALEGAYVATEADNQSISFSASAYTVTYGDGVTKTLNSRATIADWKAALAALSFEDYDEATVAQEGTVYMMDYGLENFDNKDALVALIDAVVSGQQADTNTTVSDFDADEDTTTLYDEFHALIGETFTKQTGDSNSMKTRIAVMEQFETFYDNEFLDYTNYVLVDDDNEVVGAPSYDSNTGYNFKALSDAIDAAMDDIDEGTASDTPTSEYLYLMQQYNEISVLLDYADTTDESEEIDRYLEVLNAREEADFKTSYDYKSFDAAYTKVLEDYEDATTPAKLQEYAAKLNTLVFVNTAGKSAGVDKSSLKDTINMAKDYVGDTDYGYNSTESKKSDEYVYFEEILAEANRVYTRSATYSYQSTVDAYVDYLTAAIDGLDPNSAVKDWAVLRLETAVEEAEALVETDYTTSSWKKLQTALEAAQKGLETSNLSTTRATALAEALEDASEVASGALVVKAVPSATRVALKDALEAAQDLMDEMTDTASGNQLLGLSTAINDAEDLFTTSSYSSLKTGTLISKVEAATAALEEAMTLAQHPQGWYQDENGTWFYGVGTENYTGWLELNGRTYFLKDDGSMAANTWVKTEAGYWYYLNASGAMMHDGWAKINDTWYFFKNFGGMAEGWVKDGNTWYYLTPGSGAMVSNGWSLINGKYYYFTESGAMLANTTTPDGYKVDASGAWVK